MDQDILKSKLKAWLKLNNKTYADVAEACYVTESTVRNWMAKKKIPIVKIKLLEQLIAFDNLGAITPISAESDEPKTKGIVITPQMVINTLRQLKQTYPELDYQQSVLALIGELSLY